jgi:hypothetical protein
MATICVDGGLLLDDNALVKIAILCIQSGEAYSIKAIS